ncbi:hypothetical protein VNO77_21015 [Canavalia gladiata]|uniref:Uncharacterized protein n=1 Tax=Canavalia gladiata TaxID=3824 RepID=A0AAN9LVD0_CANGL
MALALQEAGGQVLVFHDLLDYSKIFPYKISEADANGFINELQRLGLDKTTSAAFEPVQKMNTSKSFGEGNPIK